jgi:hypothetical protein
MIKAIALAGAAALALVSLPVNAKTGNGTESVQSYIFTDYEWANERPEGSASLSPSLAQLDDSINAFVGLG